MAQAVKICPDLLIIGGHYRDYSQESRQVMDYLKEITEQVEQISIDEAFLDITKAPQSSDAIAHRMQTYIYSEFSLPCSIGIASNKLVAKIATDYGKVTSDYSDSPPNAIQIVPNGKEARFLAPLPVESLWGVGPKTAAKLIEMNINTIGDLTQIPENELIKHFGKWGYALSQRSRGIDDRPISLKHKAKSISQETTFAQDVSIEDTLLETIERLSNHVSQRLIKKHLQATTIKIKLRWSDFTTITRQLTLNQPTNKKKTINIAVVNLFQKAWKKGEAIRLIGVGVSGLAPEQLNLWDHQAKIAESETEKRLSTVINDLREKFGANVLQWGDDFDDKK
jgi:DNA polymerase-4